MAQTMTASRTVYQNNYPSTSASVSADMHHSWHTQTHSSHTTSNGINGVNNNRPRPLQTTSTATSTTNRSTHSKSDFYKNGRPTEVIVIDSESPQPPPQSSKRKRDNSISTGTTVSAATKRARKSQNDETSMMSMKGPYSTTQKPHSVAWIKDERGVYRARDVMVPKVEEVPFPRPASRSVHPSDCISPLLCIRIS
jgi:hypothetical protein